jgi:hypothetical protein
MAVWPRITLRVSSAPETGLTAAVSRVLADAGISCTVIAGAGHDQLLLRLVPNSGCSRKGQRRRRHPSSGRG